MPLAAKVRRSTATPWPVRLSLRRRPLTSSRRGPLQAILRPSHNIFLNTSDPLSQSSAHLGCLPPHSSSYSPLPFSPLIVTLLVTRIVLRHQQAILHSMFTPLVVLLVLAVLLEPVAASSPVVEQTLIAAPMEQIYSYPDPDGMLDAICDVCRISVYLCDHAFPPDQTFTPALFLEHPEWPQDPLPPLAEPAPSLPYVTNSDTQPLRGDIVRSLEDNATTIQPSTIHAHLDDIYNPGDRYPGARPVGSRRPPGRRQAPKARGFPCPAEGCEKTFDRSCDLKRHQKTHLGPSERPHKCSSCNAAFLYPKDRNRHQRTHEQESSSQNPLYCCVPGCNNVDGFSRRDNLLRHQRKQHPHLIAV